MTFNIGLELVGLHFVGKHPFLDDYERNRGYLAAYIAKKRRGFP